MWILTYHDEINISFGPNSIADGVEIIAWGTKKAEVKKKHIDKDDEDAGWTDWIPNDVKGELLCFATYDGQKEERQYCILKKYINC